MTVRRYRRVEELPPPPRAASPIAGLIAACNLSRLGAAFGVASRGPRGVRRFRSVADADAHRRDWELPAGRRRAP